MSLDFHERKLKYFYAKVGRNKTLCVAYKFIQCDEIENTLFINAAGCIMEHGDSMCPKKKLRHTACARLTIRPLRWQHTFLDSRPYFRRLHIEEMVRLNNCKGPRSTLISNNFNDTCNYPKELHNSTTAAYSATG